LVCNVKEIANKISKSECTVRNKIANWKEKGILERVNGKRKGKLGNDIVYRYTSHSKPPYPVILTRHALL